MQGELEQALDKLPWFINKDGKNYLLIITRFYPLWGILYQENCGNDLILKTGNCNLLECAKEIYRKLEKAGYL